MRLCSARRSSSGLLIGIALVGCAGSAFAAGSYVYAVTGNPSARLSVIDAATNVVLAVVPLAGRNPQAVAVAPDGTFAYVALSDVSGAVAVIDTANYTVADTIPVGSIPTAVAITPDGQLAYVTNENGNSVSVIATGLNTVVATVPVGVAPQQVAITPDGSFAYVTNSLGGTVSVIKVATNTVVATVPVGGEPSAVAISPSGAFGYVTHHGSTNTVSIIATATNTVVGSIDVGGGQSGVAFTPDGAFAYVVNEFPDVVSVIATATRKVVATVSFGDLIFPAQVAIIPDGAFAYVTTYDESNLSSVAVVRTATNTVAATVPIWSFPYSVTSGVTRQDDFAPQPYGRSFGLRPAGTTSAVVPVKLNNTGHIPLNFSFDLAGPATGDFPIDLECPDTVPVGGSCKVNVQFAPTVTGERVATLTVTGSGVSNTSGQAFSTMRSVPLAGPARAAFPPGPLVFAPSVQMFASSKVGVSTGPAKIVATNTSASPVTITAISIGSGVGQDAPGSFSIVDNPCVSVLAAGASCQIRVLFTPQVLGGQRATADYTISGLSAAQRVLMYGTGK